MSIRHIVVAKYKEGVDPEEACKRFDDAVSTVSVVLAYERGPQVSKLGLEDDFTHLFQLDFKDENARNEYLRSAEHTKLAEFYKDAVEKILCFAYPIAYSTKKSKQENMTVRHVVIVRYKDDADTEKASKNFDELAHKLDIVLAYERGIQNSKEGLDGGFTHVYLLDFKDESTRDEYVVHPEHKKFVEYFSNVIDTIMVVDYPIAFTSKK